VQTTRTTPFRFTILQLRHIFLTEARTFISLSPFFRQAPSERGGRSAG